MFLAKICARHLLQGIMQCPEALVLYVYHLLYLREGGEYVGLSIAYGYRVLIVGGRPVVPCHDRPPVGSEPYMPFPHGYHRLYCYAHAGFQHWSGPSPAIVWHRRVFVHLPAYAMAGKFPYDTIALGLTAVLYGQPYVADMVAMHGLLYSLIEAFPRSAEQIPYFLGYFPHRERICGVAIVSVQQRAAVDGYYVPLLQFAPVVRHSVHHTAVNGCADACGKRAAVRVWETLERRLRTVIPNERLGNPVKRRRGDAGPDMPCEFT